MSVPALNPSDYAYGDPDKLRAHIAELMAMVAMRANMANDYAFLRDDAGLRYSMKCAAAEFRTALNLLGELTEQMERDRQRRQLRPPPVPIRIRRRAYEGAAFRGRGRSSWLGR